VSVVRSRRRVLPFPQELPKDAKFLDDAYQLLFKEGIPEHFIGRRFQLDTEPTGITTSDGRRILRFGRSGLSNAVGVALDTGHILELISAQRSPELFINTSLRSFVDTIHAIADRFPYYDTDADETEIQAVSDELLEIIRRIDPPAAKPDQYWSTFVDDSLIGDLTTEAILEITRRDVD
jgi:hypothetical protein